MPSTPKIRVERFAKLQPGELIRFEVQGVSSIGLVCDYQDHEPEKLLLLLGPNFPNPYNYPTLVKLNLTAVSFGTNFLLRLPVDLTSWSEAEPNFDCNCLMVIGDEIYFRANGSPDHTRGFVSCFINARTGVVQVTSGLPPGRYARPIGTAAYALSWEILADELEPRLILKYPF
jgi:hypothetical protein